MSNRLEELLTIWQAQQDQLEWVLATVIETQGSSYRKAGAMMLINSLGKHYGLISGGCLEADIMRKARQCWDTGENKIVCYDMREEDDLSWQLGIGCGGMVKILLQPINKASSYLALASLQQSLTARKTCHYVQKIAQSAPENSLFTDEQLETLEQQFVEGSEQPSHYFIHKIDPTPALVIFGGGIDAVPVVDMAKILGWQVTLIDQRVNYARPSYFPKADAIIRQPLTSLVNVPALVECNAVIIMNHNVELDAIALSVVQTSRATFIGLLGPKHRTEKVLTHAKLSYESLNLPLSNPVGLDIGGELPESLALSMLAEAHAALEGRKGQSLTVQ